jgi:2-iminobutanoate/2-iminopropanoate deaminase
MSETSEIKYPLIPGDVGLPDTPLPFSLATQVGNLLFVSGQASVGKDGKIISGTFEEEFRRSMENLRNILEAAGSSMKHVARVNSYVTDPADIPQYNELYREYFSAPYPARSTISKCLGGLKFELDCIAVVPSKES